MKKILKAFDEWYARNTSVVPFDNIKNRNQKPDDFDKYNVDGVYRKYLYRGIHMTEAEYEDVVADERAHYNEAGVSGVLADLNETKPSQIFVFVKDELYKMPNHQFDLTPHTISNNILKWVGEASYRAHIPIYVTHNFFDKYTTYFGERNVQIRDLDRYSLNDDTELFMCDLPMIMQGLIQPIHVWQLSGKIHSEPNRDDFFGEVTNLKFASRGFYDYYSEGE